MKDCVTGGTEREEETKCTLNNEHKSGVPEFHTRKSSLYISLINMKKK